MLDNDNFPKQRYIERQLFVVKGKQFHHPVVGDKQYGQTLVTDKGVEWIRSTFGPKPEQEAA